MLIECNYCGAPLDVAIKQDIARCRYCGKSSQVAHLRQVANETPAGWQPPRTWTPPAQFPAPSDHALRLRRRISRVIMLAIVIPVVAAAGIVAVAIGTAIVPVHQQLQAAATVFGPANAENGLEQSGSAADQIAAAVRQARQQLAEVRGLATAARQAENLFAGSAAEEFAETFRNHLGSQSVQALRLVLYPGYATIQAQNPQQPTHVDQYTYRNGTFQDPKPVRLHVRGKLEDNLFTLSDVYLDQIPTLVNESIHTLGYEADAKATHIIVEKNLPFSKHTVMRVYVSSARDSGRVDYTHTGKQLRVYK